MTAFRFPSAIRLLLVAIPLALCLAGAARAFEVGGVLRSVDPAARSIQVTAGGRLRTVRVSAEARFLDKDGKPLPAGLKAPELKEGTEVTLVVEPEDGQPVIKSLRLGLPPAGVDRGSGGRPAAPQADTSRLKALTDLGTGEYHGFPGGLYPGGKNTRPAAHEAAGLARARRVQPLDAAGKPSPDGKIVLLTIGMSNTSQSTQGFQAALAADPSVNPKLVLVNGAQGGMTAAQIQNPEDGASGARYWSEVDTRLRQAGVTRAQVQAVWIKQADAGPNQGFPGYAKTLQGELARIVQLLPGRFPNLQLAYLSSRTYGGWATTRLNPEPYAYESGFSVKWLIEQQLQGDPALSYTAEKGAARAPWLSWGPYLWANGTTKRGDGFSFEPTDFGPDGTHQSPTGQRKVGALLLQFFKTDSTTRDWFLKR